MKTIKTRNSVKNIKVLDKSISAPGRMKDVFTRTKNRAEETQNTHYSSPAEYASDNIQNTAQGAARKTVSRLPNPRHKASENWNRTKGHFQEIKRQMPKERRYAAEQAQKTAHKTKANADSLQKTAEQAQDTACEAKAAVKDAKNKLREVRQSGRQTLREIKQNARAWQSGNPAEALKKRFALSRSGASGSAPLGGKPSGQPANALPTQGSPRPEGLGKAVNVPKSVGDTTKTVKSTAKNIKDTAKGTVKTAKKTVKTAEQSAKKPIKTAQQTAKAAQKTAQTAAKTAKTAEHATRAATKAAVQTAKAATKAVIALVKATIAAIKGLITAIATGGWVVVLIILIICMIGLLVGSVFGIFFSDEPSESGKTINGVITEINTEYTNKVDGIISSNAYDLLDMSGARASWKEVLAVYTVKTVADPDNPMEVATMNDEKAAILKTVFWDMNDVSYAVDSVDVEEDIVGDDGLPTGETTTVTQTVLRITVSHKTPGEMAAQYGFTDEQKEWLAELLKPEYHYLWNALLYGITSVGDGTMIEVADTQIGNIGGEPYWSWYGFDGHVEWCACFVSWCAEQCGYIDADITPRFSGCSNGVQWFKDRDQWQDNTYTPRPGDIIFFDWEPDGECDHVGIVESVVDGKVNTIEGNTSDSVARRSYDLGSVKIYGFGVPMY